MKQTFKPLRWIVIAVAVLLVTFVSLQMINGHLVEDIGWGEFLLTLAKVTAKGLLATILSLLAFDVITHLGMLVFGCLSGYKFLGLNFLDVSLIKRNGIFKLRRRNSPNTLFFGLPLNVDAKKYPYFWLNSSIFIVCLITTIIGVFLLIKFFNHNSDNRIFILTFLFILTIRCAFFVLFELISLSNPSKYAGVGLSTVIKISSDEQFRQLYLHGFQINTLLFEGKRMSQMPANLFEDIPVEIDNSPLDKLYRLQYCQYLIDKEDYEQARVALGDIDCYKSQKLRVGYLLNMLYVELFTSRRPEEIAALCERLTIKELRNQKAFGVLYAIYILFLKDEKEAESVKASYEKHDYIFEHDRVIDAKMINLADELFASGHFVEEPITIEKSKGKRKNNYILFYIIFLVALVTVFLHFSIENGRNKDKQEIKSSSEFIKNEMTKALDSNNCYDLQRILIVSDHFEESINGYSFKDDSYYLLKKQCQERLDELDCVQ
ncbi:MAG: hypothetical protein IKW83_10310 [Muribaculaceae bacterium]|nr:hypothetical protein [Muribaculaceae bacterium]